VIDLTNDDNDLSTSASDNEELVKSNQYNAFDKNDYINLIVVDDEIENNVSEN
jgi:hypothetical protein